MSSSLNPHLYALADWDDVNAAVGHLDVHLFAKDDSVYQCTPIFPNKEVRVLIQVARCLRAAGIPLQRGSTPRRSHEEWANYYEEVFVQLGRPWPQHPDYN
jgi:hypothetical protein